MSQGGSSERLFFLRRRIAALEAQGGARLSASPPAAQDGPLGALRAALAAGGLAEVVPTRPRDCAAAAGFAFAFASPAARRGLVWIVEDMAAREIGLPYGRGLAAAGLDPRRLALVRTRRGRETLWAMEEALKAGAGAVLAESWIAPAAYDLTASRRLLLAARRGGGLGLLLPLRAAGEAARLASAADARFEAGALPHPAPPARNTLALPTPGPLAWRLRLVKARARLLAGRDSFGWRDLLFDPETCVFADAFPQRVPAPSADRPDLAPRRESA